MYEKVYLLDKYLNDQPGENILRPRLVRGGAEGGEHVVPVDQGEQTLGRGHNRLELDVIRPKDHPAGQNESSI